MCLEDDSSSTGARCVKFEETFVRNECIPPGTVGCNIDSDCCEDEECSPPSVKVNKRVCSKNGVFCKTYMDECAEDSECCDVDPEKQTFGQPREPLELFCGSPSDMPRYMKFCIT